MYVMQALEQLPHQVFDLVQLQRDLSGRQYFRQFETAVLQDQVDVIVIGATLIVSLRVYETDDVLVLERAQELHFTENYLLGLGSER